MPYSTDNPPDRIKALPAHAQEIWISTFNSEYERSGNETSANKIAWAAVKKKYHKEGEEWKENKCKYKTMNFKYKYSPRPICEDDYYWGFDCTVTKEGVMNGGYKPADEIMKIPNMLPAEVIGHTPGVNDHPEGDVKIDDDALEFGFFDDFHIEMVPTPSKNNEREIPHAKAIDYVPKSHPEIYEAITKGNCNGVSIGYYYTPEIRDGEWGNEKGEMERYNEIEHNIRIFHVARMITQYPACTPEDGCGYNETAWGDIPHNKDNHPNKGDFIIQRGDTWSDYKLPYKVKGKIHCGGVRAALSRAPQVKGGMTPEEKKRLERAKKQCKIGEYKEDEVTIQDAIVHTLDFNNLEVKTMTETNEQKLVKSTEQPLGINDLDLDAIAKVNEAVRKKLKELEDAKKKINELTEAVKTLTPKAEAYAELEAGMRDEATKKINEFDPDHKLFSEEELAEMSINELNRSIKLIANMNSAPPPPPPPSRIHPLAPGYSKPQFSISAHHQANKGGVMKQGKDGKWHRPGDKMIVTDE